MSHANEVARKARFEFGRNWQQFLAHLDDGRIDAAEQSLRVMLGVDNLTGKSFLDVGSGSGLFSLAARRLGARVHSFDYDPESVACTRELRRRYFPHDASWQVDEGSVLDAVYVGALGRFDVVYSWGVLHHTGAMWLAFETVLVPVKPGGLLFIAVYNRQPVSSVWRLVKRAYLFAPGWARGLLALFYCGLLGVKGALADALARRNPVARYRSESRRGMSIYRDVVDWLGGYPFEVASREDVIEFFQSRGLSLQRLRSVGPRAGCNEFLFVSGGATAPRA